MSWVEAVDRTEAAVKEIVAGKKPVLPLPVLVEALTGWLDSDLCEYTEGSYEALARRVVWKFSNEYIVTIGTDITITISHLSEEFTDASPMPFPESIEPSNWTFNARANGWERSENLTTEELIEFLQNLADEAGEQPEMLLPLEYKFEDVESLEDMAENYDDNDTWAAMAKLAKIFNDDEELAVLQSLSPWNIELIGEEDFMSYYCDWYKFSRFVGFLQDTGKWIVVLDEHCAACSRGSVESEVSANPALKDAPVFMTWGQNSQGAYLPNGTMWAEVYMNEEEDERFIKRHARKFGLDVGEWEGDKFEAEGSVTFGE